MKLNEQVEYVLKNYPESRNSDITLTHLIWKTFYESRLKRLENNEWVIPLNNMFDVPREDNIKRIRAKIQNVERKYLPTNIEIFIERAKASKDWKRFLGYAVDWNTEKWNQSITGFLNWRKNQSSLF